MMLRMMLRDLVDTFGAAAVGVAALVVLAWGLLLAAGLVWWCA